MDEENDDEIIVGVSIPKQEKNNKKKKAAPKKVKKETAKSQRTKKETKKNKARIFGNTVIFRNRIIKRCLLIFLMIIGIILFLSSSFFYVKNIEVSNNQVISKEEIISLAKVKDNNIFSIREKDVKKNVKENFYVDDVQITRKLPNTLNIEITERTVKYMIQLGDAYVYLNNQGYILDISSEKKETPILLGISTDISELQKGNRLNKDDLKKFEMLNKIFEISSNNDIIKLISKIDISSTRNYTLYLESEQKIVYLGDCSDLNTRILYVKAILEQESGIEGEIFVNVDLNEDNVFFREKI